jgi:hypothetical protein
MGLPQLIQGQQQGAFDLANAIPQYEFTLQPPFIHSEFHNRNWLFGGNYNCMNVYATDYTTVIFR